MEGQYSRRKGGSGVTSLIVGITGLGLAAAIFWFNLVARGYEYYVVGNAVLGFFVPMLIIFLMGQDASDFGFNTGNWRTVRWWVLAMFAGMLIVLVPISRMKEFQDYYPIFRNFGSFMDSGYRVSSFSTVGLLYGWLSYGMYMFFWEFFFRGYLLFGLARRIKWWAIILQTIPFFVLHYGKPGLEMLASIPAGLILGTLAYYSKSFVPCFVLHWAVSIASDALVLVNRPHHH